MINNIEKLLKDMGHMIMTKTKEITYKEKDIVTNLDIEAERLIIAGLKDMYPDDLFISEEENQDDLTDKATWIIDPIDGTLNFTRGIPQFGIQLARYIESKPVLAVMYFPVDKTFIHAIKGQGCYVNHKKVSIDPLPLDKAIVTFGDFSKSQPSSRPLQLKLMADFIDQVMKVRIYGASSSDFAYVVQEKTQCHVIFTKRIWEIAAGLLMITEAGLETAEIITDTAKGLMVGHKEVLDNLKRLTQVNL